MNGHSRIIDNQQPTPGRNEITQISRGAICLVVVAQGGGVVLV